MNDLSIFTIVTIVMGAIVISGMWVSYLGWKNRGSTIETVEEAPLFTSETTTTYPIDLETHLEIYRWLLGLKGDFPSNEKGKPYGWREHLLKALEAKGITWEMIGGPKK